MNLNPGNTTGNISDGVLSAGRALIDAIDRRNVGTISNPYETTSQMVGSIDAGLGTIDTDRLYSEYLTSGNPYTTTSSTATSSFCIEMQNADGTTTNIKLEEMAQEHIELKKKNEELEIRLYKLEEHVRFLTEI